MDGSADNIFYLLGLHGGIITKTLCMGKKIEKVDSVSPLGLKGERGS